MSKSFQLHNMDSRAYSLVAIFALATISVTMVHASSQTQIALSSVGNSEIDLAWNEGDRLVRSWLSFLILIQTMALLSLK